MAFPDIHDPNRIKESHHRQKIRSKFEAGYVQQRPQWTRSRKQFRLEWDVLPEADLTTLLDDFDANQGTTFDWTHPTRGTTYTVMYSSDQIGYDQSAGSAGKWYTASVDLEEL